MAKFLLTSTYTVEGLRGLGIDGGTKRAEIIQSLVENAGGRVEALYFVFGDVDAYAVCDLPDHLTAVALAIAIRASGGVDTRVFPLLRPAEVDAATRINVPYQPPGG